MNEQKSEDFLIKNLQKFVNKIPFLRNFDIKVKNAKKGLVCIALHPLPHLLNHFGSYQAGVYCTIVELAGGLLVGTFLDLDQNFLITKKVEIQFERPSKDSIFASAVLAPSVIDGIVSVLKIRKKANLMVDVAIEDAEENLCAKSQNEYYLRLGIPRSFKMTKQHS